MKYRFAAYALILALSTGTTIAAQAASQSNPTADQHANQVTDQLNRQQLRGDSGAMMSQDIQQPQPAAGEMAPQQTAQQPDQKPLTQPVQSFQSFH